MPSGTFDRSLTVSRSRKECWDVLTDVDLVSSWVSVVGSVKEIEPLGEYEAVLSDSFGPFNLNADVKVDVIEVDEARAIHFKGGGKDRQVNTSINLDARLALDDAADGTTIHTSGSWTVLGTVATMGGGTVRKKAEKIVDEFFAAAEEELG